MGALGRFLAARRAVRGRPLRARPDLVIAGGGFDLYIQHELALRIVPASLRHCPR
jgi:hypothetical protein